MTNNGIMFPQLKGNYESSTIDNESFNNSSSESENEESNINRALTKMKKQELLDKFLSERQQREELDQVLTQLHYSYDKLLAKHAEAENVIDQLRLGKSNNNFSKLDNQLSSLEFPKLLINPFTSSNQVTDSYCQTDFNPETTNQPFCSSVANFLLRANCLLEQVNSLHECVIKGINIEPQEAMVNYLWESYHSLQKDVQTHINVGQCAEPLEEIALGDINNLLSKTHSKLVTVETEQGKNFLVVKKSSSYGSLSSSPSARRNSQQSESRENILKKSSSYGSLSSSPSLRSHSQQSGSRENFLTADFDSGFFSSDKIETKLSDCEDSREKAFYENKKQKTELENQSLTTNSKEFNEETSIPQYLLEVDSEELENDKINNQEMNLNENQTNDQRTNDEIKERRENKTKIQSQQTLPKTRKHSRKLSQRPTSHNFQNDDTMAELLLKKFQETPEKSAESVEQKLQLIQALNLANKMANQLKHQSVQMLELLNLKTTF